MEIIINNKGNCIEFIIYKPLFIGWFNYCMFVNVKHKTMYKYII